MYFISTFHACATGDKVLDRFTSQVPKAVPCFDWEYLYMIFKGPHVFTPCTAALQMSFGEKVHDTF